jgi:hypothetical protein
MLGQGGEGALDLFGVEADFAIPISFERLPEVAVASGVVRPEPGGVGRHTAGNAEGDVGGIQPELSRDRLGGAREIAERIGRVERRPAFSGDDGVRFRLPIGAGRNEEEDEKQDARDHGASP